MGHRGGQKILCGALFEHRCSIVVKCELNLLKSANKIIDFVRGLQYNLKWIFVQFAEQSKTNY